MYIYAYFWYMIYYYRTTVVLPIVYSDEQCVSYMLFTVKRVTAGIAVSTLV
jgi:hypothetical protein